MLSFQLTVCGLSELESFTGARVSHVVSILDPAEPEPPALIRYGAHQRCELRFHDVIKEAPGFEAPQAHHVETILAFGAQRLAAEAPEHLLVHCHLGISRSTAAMLLLMAQARPDAAPADIAAALLRLRPQAWPNLRMVTYGDALLKRGGALRTAAREIHRRRAEADPQFAQMIRTFGREEEVEGLL